MSSSKIADRVKVNTDSFSVTETLGSFIQNNDFASGFNRFQNLSSDGTQDHNAFIYTMLSAIADELGQTVYDNVKNYIDRVSNVDTCKIKSLKSMLKLFGFTYTLFDQIEKFPQEILNLADILSIDKKYLLKTSLLDPEFFKELVEKAANPRAADDPIFSYCVDFRRLTTTNSYVLRGVGSSFSSSMTVDARKVFGVYQQTSASASADIFTNDYGFQLKSDELSGSNLYSPAGSMILSFSTPKVSSEFYSLSSCCQSAAFEVRDLSTDVIEDDSFISLNEDLSVCTMLTNFRKEDIFTYDDQAFQNFVEDIFFNVISGFVALRYNYTPLGTSAEDAENENLVYPHILDQYFKTTSQDEFTPVGEDTVLSIKAFYHIPKSFDEAAVVDAIEAGDVDLDDYTGPELSIIQHEMSLREQGLGSSKTAAADVLLQTRYSYYREQKVLEYAKFVDNYFSSANQTFDQYLVDPNYHIVSNASLSTVIKRNPAGKVSSDIDFGMIQNVAHYLAKIVSYIASIRTKLKQQTQKNYMKGTNLLFIYIVNEWLIDYAKANSAALSANGLETICKNLSAHQFKLDDGESYTINQVEYYDPTEYMNISGETTVSAELSDEANPRYWEQTTVGQTMMKFDAPAFTLNEIEKLYLSVLNTKDAVSGDLQAFLSTLFDLGADPSFIFDLSGDQSMSAFASMLSTGEYSAAVFQRLVDLSVAWSGFTSYVADDYEYPAAVISDQISNVVSVGIAVPLSTKHLADVSSVYLANIEQVQALSSHVGTLSSDYTSFISSEYSFYYKKLETKYCYEDFDVDTGEYLHDYLIGNPELVGSDFTLYELLYNLDQFSSSEHIVNWALSDTLEYVEDGFTSTYSDLKSKVISHILSCGFTDISALTLDSELDYVYKFLDAQIESRKEFLKSQLAQLQSQAANCKTAYDNLNNTFTNAVANFNDNDDGVKLGDSVVYCVSLNAIPTSSGQKYSDLDGYRCTFSTSKPAKTMYEFTRKIIMDDGSVRWYYGSSPELSTGSYAFEDNSVTPYSSSDSLAGKCAAVREFMNAPTTFTFMNSNQNDREYFYGLQSEGILAVCDTTEGGLDDLKLQYSSIASLAESLFGIDTSFSAVDLYGKILALIDALTTVDETFFVNDPLVKKYNEYLVTTVQLSSGYLPVKQAFDGIFINNEIATYLVDFSPVSELTEENLTNLRRYMLRTDKSNLQTIRAKILALYQDFDSIVIERDQLIDILLEQDVDVPTTVGTNVEAHVRLIEEALLQDIYSKTIAANAIIDYHKKTVDGYVSTISSEISASLGADDELSAAVSEQLVKLNFFENDLYKSYNQLFLSYGGREFCYDPYYNIKNQTHPSYQIHPYLWGFTEKLDTQTLLESGFKSAVVEELEEDVVTQHLRKYVGEFGQTLSTWYNAKNGLTDYSGYLSRYERSSNFTQNTGILNEVVDYDGAFYPPAVEELVSYQDECIACVSAQMSRSTLVDSFTEKLQAAALSDYLELSAPTDYDEEVNDNLIIVGQTIWDKLLADEASKFIPDSGGKQILDGLLVGTSLSALRVAKITSALNSGLPATFFDRYYRHLGLSEAQYQRIASQLTEYFDQIADHAASKSEAEAYDIYKYGLDINGNSYILYKTYDYSNVSGLSKLSFREKQNTLGDLWIRLASHPIAFPAFSGSNPAYFIFSTSQLNPTIWKHLALLDGGQVVYGSDSTTSILKIDSPMKVFYDFEFTRSKTQISLVACNPDLIEDGVTSASQFRRFDLGWVVGNQVETTYDEGKNLEWLKFMNGLGTSVERVDFRPDSTIASYDVDLEALKKSRQKDWPALIGYGLNGNSGTDFVYMFKRFSLDSAEHLGVSIDAAFDSSHQEVFVIKNTGGCNYQMSETAIISELEARGQKICGDEACTAFDQGRQTLGIVVSTAPALAGADEAIAVETTPEKVDFKTNTDGLVIEDPTADTFNSHDYLTQSITLLEFVRKSKVIQLQSVQTYNINADISYIPNYPGFKHQLSAFQLYPSQPHYSVELLGMSRDLDSYINLVNPAPDPYVDYERLQSEYLFGRVYEDYSRSCDKTYKQLINPMIGFNSPRYGGDDWKSVWNDGDVLYYQLQLDKIGEVEEAKYTLRDYMNLQVLIANPENLGKSPYAICPLASLSGEDHELQYSDSSGETLVDTKISTELSVQAEYFCVGTTDSFSVKSRSSVNTFKNIKSITARFELNETELAAKLLFKFTLEDSSQPAFIPAGAFNVLLHNQHDLTLFKYYHLLDAYGAVNCQFLVGESKAIDIPDDGRGYGIYYDRAALSDEARLSSTESYYIDGHGLRRWLKDLELSAYDHLSDIYILSGYEGLGFKYDEELRFDVSSDLYYYPTMNLKYPKQAADFVNSNTIYSLAGNLDVLKELFDESNLFILDIDDPDAVADKIGKVAVPIILNDVDDIRVFEDWNDANEELTALKNYEVYAHDDARAVRFMHFCDSGAGVVSAESGLEIPDDWWSKQTLESCLQNCEEISGLVPRQSEDLSSDYLTRWSIVNVSHETVDLKRFMKLYVNFKKSQDDGTVELYFNYFNWFDSPYIKLIGTKEYVDTIAGTYLKLKAGEDGVLDIIIQLKQYVDQKLVGYRNIRVLSYHIWNLSDDKPKFLLQKTFEIKKDSQVADAEQRYVTVTLETKTVDLSALDPKATDITIPVKMQVASNGLLQDGGKVFIDFPDAILSLEAGSYSRFAVYDAEDVDGGKVIEVMSTIYGSFELPFKTTISVAELEKYRDQALYVSVYQAQFYDEAENLAEASLSDGLVTFI